MKGKMNPGRNSMIQCGVILAVLLLASCSNKKNQKLQEIKKVDEQAKAKQNDQTTSGTTKTSTPVTVVTVGVSQEEKFKAQEEKLMAIEKELVNINALFQAQNESLLRQLQTLNTPNTPNTPITPNTNNTHNNDNASEAIDISPELCTLYLFTAHQMLRDSIIPRTMLEGVLNLVVARLSEVKNLDDAKGTDDMYRFTFHLDIAVPFKAGTDAMTEDQEVWVTYNPSKHSIKIELQSGVIMNWELTSPDTTTAVTNKLNLTSITQQLSQGRLTVQLTDRQRAQLIFLSDSKKDFFGEEEPTKLRLDDQFLLPTVYNTVAIENIVKLGRSHIQIDSKSLVLSQIEEEWIRDDDLKIKKSGSVPTTVNIEAELAKLNKVDAFRLNYIAHLAMPSQCQNLELAGIDLPVTPGTANTQTNFFGQEAQVLQKMAAAAQKDSFFEVFQSFLKNPKKQ